ncbi:MAG TPA: hypothetical protein VHA75_08215 [Rugosimonospora sp.]|nr:hypothetical protein [Rugosimonospora sp.]
MRTRLLAAALMLAVAATAAACQPKPNDGNDSGNGASPPDPCVLITPDDLVQQLGEDFSRDVESPTATPSAGPAVCGYTASETGHRVDVSVYADASGYQSLVDAGTQADASPAPVDGIGKAAVRTPTALYAVFDSFVLVIALDGVPPGESVDAALEALGRLAASRASGSPSPDPSVSPGDPSGSPADPSLSPSGSEPLPSPSESPALTSPSPSAS